ncbi:MAG: hypothetical protein ACYCV5_05590 [Acidimicrobiales bacterium]
MARTKGSALSESEEAEEKMRARRAVVRYLESQDAPAAPEPPVDTGRVEAELARIDGLLADPELCVPRRLQLLQGKRDVQTHGLSSRGRSLPGTDGLIDGFIRHAAAYAAYAAEERLGYEAFVDFGVPTSVLDKVNIARVDTSS